MKTPAFACAGLILLVSGALAQIQPPVAMPIAAPPLVQASDATSLGAVSPQEAADIANRIKLRGYIDFSYENSDVEREGSTNGFDLSSVDLDFLFDFTPVTAEIHAQTGLLDALTIEQAFINYSVNPNFGISFGRQLQLLGYEGDEATDLHQISHAYQFADNFFNVAKDGRGKTALSNTGLVVSDRLNRHYNDGVRFNFNAGKFGLALGLSNDMTGSGDSLANDSFGLDLQAAYVIMPGLEARVGYAMQEQASQEKVDQINAWLSYQRGSFTGAFEINDWDIAGVDGWSYMLMGNYQLNSTFGFTVRYSQENYSGFLDSYKVSLAPSLNVSENWALALEYSFGELDVYGTTVGGGTHDIDSLILQSIFSF
tara:strand:- start:4121 stop:5230 length:1110 start_codon:yes stop_codon:yes gene_type:complete